MNKLEELIDDKMLESFYKKDIKYRDITVTVRNNCSKYLEPINLEGLMKELCIEHTEEDLTTQGFSGYIELLANNSNSIAKIVVNKGDYETRKRFTIAHELGHFLLGHCGLESIIEDNKLYRNTNPKSRISRPFEYDANKFAARLLIPMESILILGDSIDLTTTLGLKSVATILNVSVQALCIRLGVPYDYDVIEY